jgi:tRNA modification GTPase
LERPATLLANKSDLASSDVGTSVSAVTGAGLHGLVESVMLTAVRDENAPTVNRRQEALLLEASRAISELVTALEAEGPDDLLSVLLNEAIVSLGQITGETADAEMIERIFADFCVGK